ncbi:MAG: hypothetical protein K2G55_07320 [Lachnospiraceae bacterium]|nr:hypothetical protein [Lachnospiraceae bacterium]
MEQAKESVKMTKDQIIQELMEMLKKNQQKEASNDIFEMAAYIRSMEKKLDAVTGELVNIKNVLAEMERRQEKKPLREMVSDAAEKLEQKCQSVKHQLSEVKDGIKTKAVDIIRDIKIKGKAALNRIAEFLCVKDILIQMNERVRNMHRDISHTIEKIESFGAGMREAGQKIANAFRVIADRPEADYSQKKKKFSKTEFFVKPWKEIRDRLEAVEGRYNRLIEKLDKLAIDVEMNREKAADSRSENREYSGQKTNPSMAMIAEPECQYGAELFEKHQNCHETKTPITQNITKPTAIKGR